MRKPAPPQILLLIALAWLLSMGGCGGPDRPTYEAGGTVTFGDGTPLAGGWVEFQLCDDELAPTARARIQADGSFRLGTYRDGDGALEGEHRVMILPPPPPHPRGWEQKMQKGEAAASAPPVRIDHRYRSFETSGLSFTVTPDASKNRFQIQVEPP